jgi:hypothetical protein
VLKLRYTPVIPAFRRPKQKNPKFKASLGYLARPCLKKKKKTRAGGMAQVVEYLPSKHETLSARPSTVKINK